MRKFFRIFATLLSCIVLVVMSMVLYLNQILPDSYYMTNGQSLTIGTALNIYGSLSQEDKIPKEADRQNRTAQLKMMGGVAIKEVEVTMVQRPVVVPCGYPFGIKMFTEGVVVVGFSDVESDGKFVNPAQEAGIRVGDVIIQLGGEKMAINEQVEQVVKKSKGGKLAYTLKRKDKTINGYIYPVLADNGEYKAGVWVRDSSAGIGTMTYYDPTSMVFAGLGHAVCDVDTGEVMPLGKGEIVDVTITGVGKGQTGKPGELQGVFNSDMLRGFLVQNNETGVYGRLKVMPAANMPMPLALKQEVQSGPAQIYTTLEGNVPKAYDIIIEKINLNEQNSTKNMIIRVTDTELLEKAGGIVQGMSGSPIIQNNMLVGAVTHVFVNDLTRGYGIFAENMNVTAQAVRQSSVK